MFIRLFWTEVLEVHVCHHYAMSSVRHWHFSPVNSEQTENQVRDCYGDVKEIIIQLTYTERIPIF